MSGADPARTRLLTSEMDSNKQAAACLCVKRTHCAGLWEGFPQSQLHVDMGRSTRTWVCPLQDVYTMSKQPHSRHRTKRYRERVLFLCHIYNPCEDFRFCTPSSGLHWPTVLALTRRHNDHCDALEDGTLFDHFVFLVLLSQQRKGSLCEPGRLILITRGNLGCCLEGEQRDKPGTSRSRRKDEAIC